MKKAFIIVAVMFTSFTAFNQTYNQSNLFYNTNKTYIKLVENPARGQINVQISNPYNQKYDLSLYSLSGKKVAELAFTHTGGISIKTMYISDGTTGMYFLVAKTSEGKQSIKVYLQ